MTKAPHSVDGPQLGDVVSIGRATGVVIALHEGWAWVKTRFGLLTWHETWITLSGRGT